MDASRQLLQWVGTTTLPSCYPPPVRSLARVGTLTHTLIASLVDVAHTMYVRATGTGALCECLIFSANLFKLTWIFRCYRLRWARGCIKLAVTTHAHCEIICSGFSSIGHSEEKAPRVGLRTPGGGRSAPPHNCICKCIACTSLCAPSDARVLVWVRAPHTSTRRGVPPVAMVIALLDFVNNACDRELFQSRSELDRGT